MKRSVFLATGAEVGDEERARALALPFVPSPPDDASFALVRRDGRLGLEALQPSGLGRVEVDFVGGRSGYRAARDRARHELVVRACGILRGGYDSESRVLDATGGLGRDAWMLAAAGARVTLAERAPLIAALLDDGLRRAREAGSEVAARMELVVADAASLCATSRPAVIYLDPMYPPRPGAALGGRELRLLAELVGSGEDRLTLLEQALAGAGERVVMKRPRWVAAPTGELAPHATRGGRSTAFDLWMVRSLPAALVSRLGRPRGPGDGSAGPPGGTPRR